MTRKFNGYGPTTAFGLWCRTALEDSSSLAITDIDWIFHRFRTPVDRVGTREVQQLMQVEVKTHGSDVRDSQAESLFYHHQLLYTAGKNLRRCGRPDVMVRHYGVYVLKLSSDEPATSRIEWGMFDKSGHLSYLTGSVEGIMAVLNFERDPRKPMQKIDIRRHHKTSQIVSVEKTELGFEVDTSIIKRS